MLGKYLQKTTLTVGAFRETFAFRSDVQCMNVANRHPCHRILELSKVKL